MRLHVYFLCCATSNFSVRFLLSIASCLLFLAAASSAGVMAIDCPSCSKIPESLMCFRNRALNFRGFFSLGFFSPGFFLRWTGRGYLIQVGVETHPPLTAFNFCMMLRFFFFGSSGGTKLDGPNGCAMSSSSMRRGFRFSRAALFSSLACANFWAKGVGMSGCYQK